MNKTAIKNFAIWARVTLIDAVKQKAFEYEITEDKTPDSSVTSVGGRLLTEAELRQRGALVDQIRQKGYTQVMEEVAYTWFNRFIALRYMEVNNFLPLKTRIFSDENDAFNPEILKEAMNIELDGVDKDVVYDLLEKQDNEKLYKYLLIAQCNALGESLPGMFEKIEDYTELLFPNKLLKADSVLGKMVTEIPTEDWEDAVQIIGWMYQYYNAELKDDTFAKLKKNIKISKERIPAATQLFTPDWIVRYMVENSLGRIFIADSGKWLNENMTEAERAAKEKEVADSFGWKYYLPEAEQTEEVRKQLITNH
ncbi:MAG: SAM-dependent methyltransferase, partial [Ruminococcus sp.]|nr:SAM-dependent methyltransferase [Candidatus Copronaster equi]